MSTFDGRKSKILPSHGIHKLKSIAKPAYNPNRIRMKSKRINISPWLKVKKSHQDNDLSNNYQNILSKSEKANENEVNNVYNFIKDINRENK
jgi:hypothetical protein